MSVDVGVWLRACDLARVFDIGTTQTNMEVITIAFQREREDAVSGLKKALAVLLPLVSQDGSPEQAAALDVITAAIASESDAE